MIDTEKDIKEKCQKTETNKSEKEKLYSLHTMAKTHLATSEDKRYETNVKNVISRKRKSKKCVTRKNKSPNVDGNNSLQFYNNNNFNTLQ